MKNLERLFFWTPSNSDIIYYVLSITIYTKERNRQTNRNKRTENETTR